MAGDWLKIEKATARKPEVLQIAESLGVTPDEAFGMCFRFWSWCDDNMETCNARGVTPVTLNMLLGRDGFAQALVKCGWLLVRDGSLEVPNFDRHLSMSAKKRALSQGRTAKSRSRSCNALGVTEVLPEKRREEKSNKEKSKPKKTFKKPALQDIELYAAELKLDLDVGQFFDYYESKGWMVGKSPMKDWQATLRNWVRRSKQDQPKSRVFPTEELKKNPNALAEYGYAPAMQEDEQF